MTGRQQLTHPPEELRLCGTDMHHVLRLGGDQVKFEHKSNALEAVMWRMVKCYRAHLFQRKDN